MNVDEKVKSVIGQSARLRSASVGSPPLIFYLVREKCASPWNTLFPRQPLPRPYYLTTLLLTFTLSIHPLVRRDVACNVSVWIVSGYVGDVARYVSTGWWNRERPGTLCSCMIDDELGLRIHLLLSRPIVGNASRWVGSRQSTSLCVIYYILLYILLYY